MPTNATSFSGPTHVMALTHPFVTPAYRKVGGIPLLIDILARDYFGSDLWRAKNDGIIPTKRGLFLGNVGVGKSALVKIAAVRMIMMSAGFGPMHAVINDYKSEANDSEYAKLSAVTQSVVFRMAAMSFNPFEARLYIDKNDEINILGIMNMAEVLAEFSKKSSLSSVESVANTIALRIMFDMDKVTWEPAQLEKLTRAITVQQIDSHYNQIDERLVTRLTTRAEQLEDTVLRELTMRQIDLYGSAQNNYRVEEIQAAGVQVSNYYHNLLYGKTGAMFGSTHSMYDLYTQRVVTKDWRGLTLEAETLLRTIDNSIRTTAIENNRMDLLPHLNVDDEMHRPMDNLAYAKSTAFLSEIQRSTPTVDLGASHRLASIRRGGEGSELYGYGETIINNLGFALLGRQQNDPVALKELAERFRLKTANKNALTTLPARCFILVLGEKEPARLVRSFATPSEIAILPTNQANDYILDRPNAYNESHLRRYADENGFVLVPPSESKVG